LVCLHKTRGCKFYNACCCHCTYRCQRRVLEWKNNSLRPPQNMFYFKWQHCLQQQLQLLLQLGFCRLLQCLQLFRVVWSPSPCLPGHQRLLGCRLAIMVIAVIVVMAICLKRTQLGLSGSPLFSKAWEKQRSPLCSLELNYLQRDPN